MNIDFIDSSGLTVRYSKLFFRLFWNLIIMPFLWLRKNLFSFQALWTVDDSEFQIGHGKIGTFANVKILLLLESLNLIETYLFPRMSFHLSSISFHFKYRTCYLGPYLLWYDLSRKSFRNLLMKLSAILFSENNDRNMAT